MRLNVLNENPEKCIVPIVYNYDSVLIGQSGNEWKFPDTNLKSGETPEEAAIRACGELGLNVKTFKSPFTEDHRKNVTFVYCCYHDGCPKRIDQWTDWKWVHPTHAMVAKGMNEHDSEVLKQAPYHLATPQHKSMD